MIAVIGIAKAKIKVKLGIPGKEETYQDEAVMNNMPPEMEAAYGEAMRARDQLWEGVGREHGVFGGYDSVSSKDTDEITTEFRGTAYKAACHLSDKECLAGADEEVVFISAAGRDLTGDALISDLQRRGVNTSCIARSDGKTPIEVEVVNFINDLQFARSNRGLAGKLTPEFVDRYSDVISQASVIVVDGTLPEETISHISGTYGDKTKIVFDPGSIDGAERVKLRKSQALSGVYCVVPGRMEAEEICGRSILGRDKLAEAASLFSDKGVDVTVITMKGGGLYYSAGDEEDILRPERVLNFAEPEGAGDVVTAAIACGISKGLSAGEACRLAMDAAAEYLKDIEDVF